MLLNIKNIKKEMKNNLLFENVNLIMNEGERIGIIGDNGSGKTTFLQLIAGLTEPTVGKIQKETPTYFVPQHVDTSLEKSGGEAKKVQLDKAFAQHDALLLLDEPTTNLDHIQTKRLIRQLKQQTSGYIIITHDRQVLTETCNILWVVHNQGITAFHGNYEEYREQQKRKHREHERAYENYTTKKAQLETAIQKKDKQAQRASAKPKNLRSSEARASMGKPYYAKKEKKLNKTSSAMKKRLEQLEVIAKPKELAKISMYIPNQETLQQRTIVQANELTISIQNRTLIQPASFSIKSGEKIAITGDNGVGKSTLLHQLLFQKSEHVHLHPQVKIGYFAQKLETLDLNKTVYENVADTSIQPEHTIRTVLAQLQLPARLMDLKAHELSGGQQVKLALAKVFVSDANILVFDEPTNYLDISAIEGLEYLLQHYPGTLILISHDKQFVEAVTDKQWRIHHQFLETELTRQIKPKGRTLEEKTKQQIKNELLQLDMKITALISELALIPSDTGEQQLQHLFQEKRDLEKKA